MHLSAIRVVQAVAWYPPGHVGGTEVYLSGLVGALHRSGIASTVLVPSGGAPYRHGGVSVETYPDYDLEAFTRRLTLHQGAIYHQHSWTGGCGPRHLEAARALGMSTVLTVHVPGVVCLRGDMMHLGRTPCDARIDPVRCGACRAHGQGLPVPLGRLLGRVPRGIAARMRRLPARLGTILGQREIGEAKRSEFCEMLAAADRVVVVCRWLHDAFAANGADVERVILSRQGVDDALAAALVASADTGGPLRLLYLGRFDRGKGVDVAVEAVRRCSDPNLELTVHTPEPAADQASYVRAVRARAARDPRIRFEPAVSRDRLPAVLARHDALLVPSRWLETGPLVVLEAQAAGLPVLGSALGGIAELAEPDAGDVLLPVDDVAAWSHAISRLAAAKAGAGLNRLGRPVRTMSAAAQDMAALYAGLVATFDRPARCA
jgi:glycosyltransferase involved in cell wall biosynthesis